MTGDNAARRADDIGGQELSYAEVKAIASGNPAVLTLAEADAELQRLTLLKKNHLDEQFVARRNVRDLPAMIAGLSDRLAKLSADETTAKAHADDPVAIGGRTYPREDIPAILGGKLDALPMSAPNATRITIGTYHGLRFGVVLHTHFPPDVYLEGGATRQTMLSREHQGPRAVLNALERLAGGVWFANCRSASGKTSLSHSPSFGTIRPGSANPSCMTPTCRNSPACVTSSRPGFQQRPSCKPTEPGRRRPSLPDGSRHLKAPTPSRPCHSVNGRSIPPPRNPSPPALGGGLGRFPPPSHWYHPPRPNRCQGRPSCPNPRPSPPTSASASRNTSRCSGNGRIRSQAGLESGVCDFRVNLHPSPEAKPGTGPELPNPAVSHPFFFSAIEGMQTIRTFRPLNRSPRAFPEAIHPFRVMTTQRAKHPPFWASEFEFAHFLESISANHLRRIASRVIL